MREVNCKDFIPSSNKFIALFVADWCSYCRRLLNELKGKSFKIPIILVKINDINDECWDKFEIEVVPTAMLYENGRAIKKKFSYRGLSPKDIEELCI